MNKNSFQLCHLLGLAASVLLLSGCRGLKQPPQPTLGSTVTPAAWSSPAQAGPVAEQWLAGFGDEQLSRLVNEALTNNPDLAATAAKLDESLASARIAGAALLPTVELSASGQNSSRLQRSTEQKNAGLQANSSAFGASLDLSWELDVWGRLRSAKRSALETAAASASDYEAARRSLAAQVAKSWFASTEAQLQLQLNQESVATYQQTLRLVQTRFSAGAIAEQDLANAKADLASARQRLESSATSFKAAVRSLELLLGRYPAAELKVAAQLAAVPPAVPAGLPAELLQRRPDIRAAQQRLASAFHLTQQAKAARLPRISLTSSLGSSSTELKDLLDPKNAALNFAGNLLAPVFEGGARKAQVQLAQAQQREAAAGFRSVALGAFQEVETFLLSGESLARQEQFFSEAAQQYEKARRLGETRYAAGDVDLVDVLVLQRQELQAKSSLLSVRAQQLSERVNLHLALGGGFEAPAAAAN